MKRVVTSMDQIHLDMVVMCSAGYQPVKIVDVSGHTFTIEFLSDKMHMKWHKEHLKGVERLMIAGYSPTHLYYEVDPIDRLIEAVSS